MHQESRDKRMTEGLNSSNVLLPIDYESYSISDDVSIYFHDFVDTRVAVLLKLSSFRNRWYNGSPYIFIFLLPCDLTISTEGITLHLLTEKFFFSATK